MSKVVSLDEYREALTVRSITYRLLQRGYDPVQVRKTIAGLLMQKGSSVSLVELCALAIWQLENPGMPVKLPKPRKRLHSGAEQSRRCLKLVRNDS